MLAGGLTMTEWYCGTVVLWYLPVLYTNQLYSSWWVVGWWGWWCWWWSWYQHPTRLYTLDSGQGTHRICADMEKSGAA